MFSSLILHQSQTTFANFCDKSFCQSFVISLLPYAPTSLHPCAFIFAAHALLAGCFLPSSCIQKCHLLLTEDLYRSSNSFLVCISHLLNSAVIFLLSSMPVGRVWYIWPALEQRTCLILLLSDTGLQVYLCCVFWKRYIKVCITCVKEQCYIAKVQACTCQSYEGSLLSLWFTDVLQPFHSVLVN